ncbi:MAG TPA: DUF1800 domain-containing protein [Stellaceae bacterium]|nr:DUF1800 domain-containing protein [Stellaceae bacterium]
MAAPPSDAEVIRVLNRVAFGPTAADVAHVREIGIDRYIAEQLNPQSIPESPELTRRLAALDTLKLDPIQLFQEYGPVRAMGGVKPTPDEQKARRQRSRVIVEEAQDARVLRALYSRRQLEEVMVQFWFNHFNVFAQKGLDRIWVGAYERDAIRPYALGHFRDLLLATAKSPAMLFYLDNWQNSAPGSRLPGGREVGINENYAREIMELHTLGVDGGYSQADVISLAHVLTGWGFARPREIPHDRSGFLFDPARHDFSPKTFLGRTIQPSGEAEGIEAVDMLARSPATARHIAFELAQYFVADQPPQPLVDRLAARFSQTDGDVAAVLRTLFESPEFRGGGEKYKTPYRFVLSAVRAAGLQVTNPRPLIGMMARLGMPLYGCPTPDGYKTTEAAWLSPEATTHRVSLATAIAGGRLPLAAPAPADMMASPAVVPVADKPEPAPVDAAALETLLAPVLSARTRAVIDESPPALRAALVLGSPDFMRE